MSQGSAPAGPAATLAAHAPRPPPPPGPPRHLHLLDVEKEQQFGDLHGGQEWGEEDPQPEEGMERRGLQSRGWGPDPHAAS